MKLHEVLLRGALEGKVPAVGDHEIVEGPDGLAHMLIISHIDIDKHPPEFGFICPCMVFPNNTDTRALEVKAVMTCLDCMSKT